MKNELVVSNQRETRIFLAPLWHIGYPTHQLFRTLTRTLTACLDVCMPACQWQDSVLVAGVWPNERTPSVYS